MKNQYRGEDCLKNGGGGLGQFVDLRGMLGEKEGMVFFRGGLDTVMHIMCGTWKSKGIKLNTWKYDLIEQLNKIIN